MIEEIAGFHTCPSASGPRLAMGVVELVTIHVLGAEVEFEGRVLQRHAAFLQSPLIPIEGFGE
jgi:hypothetical protein